MLRDCSCRLYQNAAFYPFQLNLRRTIFMKELIATPVPGAFEVSSMALLFSVCILFPFAGILSDRYGRKRIMVRSESRAVPEKRCLVLIPYAKLHNAFSRSILHLRSQTTGGVTLCIFSPLLVWLISRGNSILAFCSQSLLGVALSMWGAPMCAWLVESFEPESRLTSVAIGYNVAQAVAGGSAPFFATLLHSRRGAAAPGILITVLAIASLTGLLVVSPSSAANHKVASGKDFSSVPNGHARQADECGQGCELVRTESSAKETGREVL